jgi:hypothetical protein
MTQTRMRWMFLGLALLANGSPLPAGAQSNWTLIGWNNLGMHCMDSDYSVFSILPPYNTIHAQLINGQGKLVTNSTGIGITYHAIADLDGSFNSFSEGKGNFRANAAALFGLALPPETGLPVPGPESFSMPGRTNVPQAMKYEASMKWFAAYGVPITPYDDAGKPNQYPMMRLMATNGSGQVLAMTDIVLPVSDEMDCKLCHASGSEPAAEPAGGWIWAAHPGRDYRLNILRLHDEHNLTNATYRAALATHGFSSNGLAATVTEAQRPILCAACHLSEALPGSGLPDIPPLTTAMHGRHADVLDPRNGMTLDATANRVGCYSCHPGSVTRCLRGAMGKAVAADGSMMMQCQSCHGTMSAVGDPGRVGWLEEPNCQACHVGSATNTFGVIRFLDAFSNGVLRTPSDRLFATSPHTPLTNTSLYRFSAGHGGIQCSACHGSTHAEFPSALPADNVGNIERQGHAGVLNECTACHQTMPATRNGGPHGMHQIGQSWINDHNNAAQALGLNACRTCHGSTGQGTVLSLAFSEKTITSERGNIHYWKGRKVTCYGCHNGMNTGDPTTRLVPTITNVTGVTTSGIPLNLALSGPNTRIVEQARHGAVALVGTLATYYPDLTFAGTDTFTFAANNGYNDSELGTATVVVHGNPAGVPAPEAAQIIALGLAPTNAGLNFSSSLGQAYRIESTTNLLEDAWVESVTSLWGHTDATWAPDARVFDFIRLFRVSAVPAPAISPAAADSATNSTYDGGWNNGSNGGTGFDGWSLTVSNGASGGFFTATTANGDMSMAARAWGLWANSGATASAFRTLNQPLTIGQALALRFDNGTVQNGAQVGVGLLNTAGQTLTEFFFIGGQGTYRVNDRAGSRVTLIPWSNAGWDLTFRMAAAGEYHLSCGDYVVSGLLKTQADQVVTKIRLWNANAGSGSTADVYVDQLRVLNP